MFQFPTDAAPVSLETIPTIWCNIVLPLAADLDGLSKLTHTLYEKLSSSGISAIPLDSEMLQLDYQATIRKGQEEAELNRITLQRVQTNCATLSKGMSAQKK